MAVKFDYAEITFDYPETGTGARSLEELQRCARALFSIIAGTLPMDREFGISLEYIDRPLPVAESFYVQEAYEKVERYLPECEISDIKFESDKDNGKLTPHIYLTVKEIEEEEADE